MIGQHFREGQTVIMDVTGMPMPEATRMVDFAAGLAYGCEGRIERIADRVFLLAPAHVEIENT
jgi:cell division inhibitor SepF